MMVARTVLSILRRHISVNRQFCQITGNPGSLSQGSIMKPSPRTTFGREPLRRRIACLALGHLALDCLFQLSSPLDYPHGFPSVGSVAKAQSVKRIVCSFHHRLRSMLTIPLYSARSTSGRIVCWCIDLSPARIQNAPDIDRRPMRAPCLFKC